MVLNEKQTYIKNVDYKKRTRLRKVESHRKDNGTAKEQDWNLNKKKEEKPWTEEKIHE